VIDWIIRVLINAAGVYVATLLPFTNITFNVGSDWWKLLAVALILALVNSFIKPIVKLLSFPVSLFTLGLVGFVINGAMLLLVALASDQFKLGFKIGGFPPTLNADAVVGAIAAAFVISVVSTLLGMVNRGRKIVA
jgi:putative membrane protein